MNEHELRLSDPSFEVFRASDGNLSLAARPGMTWECSCGQWSKRRSLNTGAPFREGAERAHRKHVKEAANRIEVELDD